MTITTVPSVDRRVELRVKIKSLAAESRIIRLEERRIRAAIARSEAALAAGKHAADEVTASIASARLRRTSLQLHRTNDVRSECRASLLAYALLRGRTLAQAEPMTPPLTAALLQRASRVSTIANRFGGQTTGESVLAWMRVPR